jgi:hypothetical protein
MNLLINFLPQKTIKQKNDMKEKHLEKLSFRDLLEIILYQEEQIDILKNPNKYKFMGADRPIQKQTIN